MKWREPNAYTRKGLAHGKWIGLLIVLGIAPLFLIWDRAGQGFSARHVAIIILFVMLGLCSFLFAWLGPGETVWLKEDYIARGSGRSANRSLYKNIECCQVRSDVYRGVSFTILTLSVRKGLPVGQVTDAVIPEAVDVNRVLEVLREKGVKVVQAESSRNCPEKTV